MTIWSGEIKELDKLYISFKGHLPEIVKEMEQLIRTDDANVVMLYSRRCLEVIVTDLCECELKRPRKTEPLKGIIDKLNSEEKVPSHIITSMLSLNSMATYGTHPKDFDPEQVKPVLNNLAIIIRWYLKYKDFQVVSKKYPEEEKSDKNDQKPPSQEFKKPKRRTKSLVPGIIIGLVIAIVSFIVFKSVEKRNENRAKAQKILDNTGFIIDERDNQRYRTIKIGSQVWMGENLKATIYNDGTPIPHVQDSAVWNYIRTPAYCWYNNDEAANRETYGALYNWYVVGTGKLCPVGWHVPSDAEWSQLINFLGGEEEAGDKLKEAGNEHWSIEYADYTNPDNGSGFTALPGGYRGSSDIQAFESMGYLGTWWSSTDTIVDYFEAGGNFAKRCRMEYSYKSILSNIEHKAGGFSVRCVKDK